MFPRLNLEKVRNAIKNHPEFIENHKDNYIIFNYGFNSGLETFPNDGSEESQILRECRGLTFDESGIVRARKYHKFFNIGEREETNIENIDMSKPHYLLKKLDGSLITPWFNGEYLTFHTKNGETDISKTVNNFIKNHENLEGYYNFCFFAWSKGMTPIFEWMSNKNRIVVAQPEDNLVLTGLRINDCGEYISYPSMKMMAENYGVPVVEAVSSTQDLNEIIRIAKSLDNEEGFVITFDDGSRYKVKSDWYVNLHRAKSDLMCERKVLNTILLGSDDDLVPSMDEEDKKRFNMYKKQIFDRIYDLMTEVYLAIKWNMNNRIDRKMFALDNSIKKEIKPLIFSSFNDPDVDKIRENIIKLIMKNLGSNQAFSKIKNCFLKDIEYNIGMFKNYNKED